MPRHPGIRPLLFLAAALLFCGCAPEIGDECSSAIDCSQTGDRLCDTTQAGGYCTVYNCEPDSCPGDVSICVAFDHELDPACRYADDGEWARFERTFCMRICDSNDDCRDGYECIDPLVRNALVVDFEPAGSKICIIKAAAPYALPAEVPEVCKPAVGDAGLPPPYEPETGTGGAGGAGGSGIGGAAGSGGAGGT